MHTHTHAHTHIVYTANTHTHACNVHTHKYMHARTHTCMHVRAHIIHARIVHRHTQSQSSHTANTHMRAYAHARTHTRTHTHTHTHAYIHAYNTCTYCTQTDTLTQFTHSKYTRKHTFTLYTLTQYRDSTHGKHDQPHGRWLCKFIIYVYAIIFYNANVYIKIPVLINPAYKIDCILSLNYIAMLYSLN